MQTLNKFKTELDDIVRQSRTQKHAIGGSHIAWLMMIVGVVVTGTMTYSLTHEGMKSSALWQAWVDFAAFLPVTLLEGSAIALVYGKHHWFTSTDQRRLADVAGWCIWILLALTSIAHFALGKHPTGSAKSAMDFYAAYILPLSIVAAPMLWKRLYDAAPESKIRTAALEADAAFRSELISLQVQHNAIMLAAMRKAQESPEVADAQLALFRQSSVDQAAELLGMMPGAEQIAEREQQRKQAATQPVSQPVRQVWRGGVNVTTNQTGNA